MKKLFLLSLLSLYSGVLAVNCDVTIEVDSHKMHHVAEFDENHYLYPCDFADNQFKVIMHLDKETKRGVEMRFQVFKKNKNGQLELIAQPSCKADFGKTATVSIKNRNKTTGKEHSIVVQVVANK